MRRERCEGNWLVNLPKEKRKIRVPGVYVFMRGIPVF